MTIFFWCRLEYKDCSRRGTSAVTCGNANDVHTVTAGGRDEALFEKSTKIAFYRDTYKLPVAGRMRWSTIVSE